MSTSHGGQMSEKTMKSSIFSTLFHIFMVWYCFIYLYKLYTNETIQEIMTPEMRIAVLQCGTTWCMLLFEIFYIMTGFYEILLLTPDSFCRDIKRKLQSDTNELFTVYVVPTTLGMCLNFWVLFHLDADLIDTYNVRDKIDPELNHLAHTYTAPVLFFEIFVSRKQYPSSLLVTYPYKGMIKATAIYVTFTFGLKLFSSIWPYPFFRNMTIIQWILYVSLNVLLMFLFYAMGFIFNSYIWGPSDLEQDPPLKGRKHHNSDEDLSQIKNETSNSSLLSIVLKSFTPTGRK